jgi:Lon protease-like protein
MGLQCPRRRAHRAYGEAVLPLFPLGTVLFPGATLPLHIFEERYRRLVADLVALPEQDRVFGVVALREGREVGADAAVALHAVGCTAHLASARRYPDGRFDLVTVGRRRFTLTAVHGPDGDRPYLAGEVRWLTEPAGATTDLPALARATLDDLSGYRTALAEVTGTHLDPPDLPVGLADLSHAIAGAVVVEMSERQALLACPDTSTRLQHARRLLRRETVLLRELAAAPAQGLARTPYSNN